MNKTAFCLLLAFLLVSVATAQCNNAYSTATYALAHTKKSLNSDNFDHQQLYAERAIASFEKDRDLVKSCGCEESLQQIDKGLDNLYKAVDPKDWDEGRYYTKKALANAHELINTLDLCTSRKAATTVDYGVDLPTESGSGSSNISVADHKNNLLDKQEQFDAEQQKIIKEQKQLDREIEEQRKLAGQSRYKRQMELDQQIKLKRVAEASLLELEKNLKEIAINLGCEQAIGSLNVEYEHSDESLSHESLEQTRQYYLQQTIIIQQLALDVLKNRTVSK
ncbi:hypothetical protein K8352_08350 [Flavobacteriaceae bacterium F89]|uniref:Uncharacterized protein n=1 Tax=Cerina litoralis TaxID=2874477 RepID=A0AAE3JP89_9FLAO|nr:hypothetical protein [Cerina litoralis]MCG2460756.1 hypothetical protein [Cerina litoralis]